MNADLMHGVKAQRAVRSHWRTFSEDEEVAGLVVQVVQAQRDMAVAHASLERLLERCRPLAWQIARTYAPQEADAADIVQEALLQLALHLAQLRDPAAFPHWFATLAHNAARQWRRRERARRLERALDADGGADAAHVAGDGRPGWRAAFDAVEVRDQLQRLLAIVPPRERDALLRFHATGRSQAEIGRRLGVSARAVEGMLYRAEGRLRAVAEQCADDFEDLGVWCHGCGRCRLQGRLRVGFGPAYPLLLQAHCPGCDPGNYQAMQLPLPFARYPSLGAALIAGFGQLGRIVHELTGIPTPHCLGCGTPTIPGHERASLAFHWRCLHCGMSTDSRLLSLVAARPAFRAFWYAAPRLRVRRPRHICRSGVEAAELTAWDPDSGRTATAVVALDTLRVRALRLPGPDARD